MTGSAGELYSVSSPKSGYRRCDDGQGTPTSFRAGLHWDLSVANIGLAQAVGNAPAPTPLLQKVAIGVGVWLVTAILAYVAWTLLKVVAKIGVILFPVLAGVAVATLLPNQITSDAVMSIGVPCVTSAVAASLVCYLYANFYDIERELSKVEQSKAIQSTPSPPTNA